MKSKIFLLLLLLLPACKKTDTPIAPYDSTPFSLVPEPDYAVIYEVNQRAFSSSGNFSGITARLTNIRQMSANVLWLMPIHPIGTVNSVNSPYSVKDYLSVNPEFGTLDDLRLLVAEAHKKGIAVILDWVANHTAWDHPWIKNKPWYTQDASGNIIMPPGTNWQDVADLNYDNTEMRLAMIDAMKFWILNANIDGFRCDAADMVPFDFWKQALDSLKALPGRKLLFIAEGERKDHFQAGFQFIYGWSFYNSIKRVIINGASPAEPVAVHAAEYNAVPSGKHIMRFTTNHDQSAWDATPVTLFGGKKAAIAASIATLFLGGRPLLYGGQETGRTTTIPFFSRSPIDWSLNPDFQAEYRNIFAAYSRVMPPSLARIVLFPHPYILAFALVRASDTLAIAVNMRNSVSTMANPSVFRYTKFRNIFGTGRKDTASVLTLQPYEYIGYGSELIID